FVFGQSRSNKLPEFPENIRESNNKSTNKGYGKSHHKLTAHLCADQFQVDILHTHGIDHACTVAEITECLISNKVLISRPHNHLTEKEIHFYENHDCADEDCH